MIRPLTSCIAWLLVASMTAPLSACRPRIGPASELRNEALARTISLDGLSTETLAPICGGKKFLAFIASSESMGKLYRANSANPKITDEQAKKIEEAMAKRDAIIDTVTRTQV